jgi:hypothetical protein
MHANNTLQAHIHQPSQQSFWRTSVAPTPVRADRATSPRSKPCFPPHRATDRTALEPEFNFSWPRSPRSPRVQPCSDQTVVQIGDLVSVRFSDAPSKELRVWISKFRNAPEQEIAHANGPLGRALLGNAIGDTFELRLKTGIRVGRIMQIERGTQAMAAA